MASAIDTGKVKGKEFDLSATVTIGPGSGISGSVGKGKTTGETEWVENQTRISARDKVDIRTENHTQLDGALIASDNGNLKLDTGTLGHRDIAGKDQEHGYYLNVGGSWKPVKNAKDEKSATVSGWEYEKDREQIVRATVGAGDITVRGDAATGQDSTVGLNRDLDKAYQITRDHESRTDLYISDTAVNDALHPVATVNRWSNELRNYDETALKNLEQAGNVVNVLVNRFERLQGRQLDAGAVAIGGVKLAEDTYEALLMANFKPDEAKALMRTPSFQQEVLARLNQIEHVFDKHEESTTELTRLWMELAPTPITERRGPVQMALTYSSQINEYLDADPERG